MEIKDILYSAIQTYSEKKIASDFSQGNSAKVISTIFNNCMPHLTKLNGNKAEVLGTFTEGLVHYLLTTTLISSQRKVSHDSTRIDIVIPDIATLKISPQDAVVIEFPKTMDTQIIKHRIEELTEIQPNKQNLWFVLENDLPLDVKVYTLDGKGRQSFANIINDITSFSYNKKQSKLKIFKI